MRYSEARQGRAFVIRLEDGEILHEVIEQFARDHGIRAAALIAVGGADKGSKLIVGPAEGRAAKIVSQELVLDDANEVAGTGTLFPDEDGHPMLHMHVAAGRNREAVVGCTRSGLKVWHVLEVILIELLDTKGVRKLDRKLGFKLLDPSP